MDIFLLELGAFQVVMVICRIIIYLIAEGEKLFSTLFIPLEIIFSCFKNSEPKREMNGFWVIQLIAFTIMPDIALKWDNVILNLFDGQNISLQIVHMPLVECEVVLMIVCMFAKFSYIFSSLFTDSRVIPTDNRFRATVPRFTQHFSNRQTIFVRI